MTDKFVKRHNGPGATDIKIMLEKIITFALQQRVFVLAGALVLLIAGWQATENLPIEAFPDVQDVQVQIVTQAPGQAPEEVERSVTLPIEREMSGVPRQTQLRSVSITGKVASGVQTSTICRSVSMSQSAETPFAWYNFRFWKRS